MNDITRKGKTAEIPEKYRRKHYAGCSVTVNKSKRSGNASVFHSFYIWESFNGEACFVSVNESNPTIALYINGSLWRTYSNIQQAVRGCNVYEVWFTGLSYGDTYYATVNGDFVHNTRTYKGGRGSAPSLSTTDSDINARMTSPYNQSYSMAVANLTFNSDYGSLNSYSRQARNLLYVSCFQMTESDAILGKVGNLTSQNFDMYDPETGNWDEPSAFTHEAQLTKFYSGVAVGILSSRSTNNYSYFSQYVNEWISDVNQLIGYEFFYRDDNITEDQDDAIHILIGSHQELFGYNPDNAAEGEETYVYYGHWAQTRWYTGNGATSHCEVKLCNELRESVSSYDAFKDITYEELTECLGCGNDTFNTYESMFSEIWYQGKTNRLLSGGRPTADGEVVQMIYNELDFGEFASQVIHKLTPSESAVIQLPSKKYGVSGNNYTVRAYSMNRQVTYSGGYWYLDSSNNCFSDLGSSIVVTPSIFIGGVRPDKWYWSFSSGDSVPVDSYGIHPVTASEWNRFTERINEFRAYAGYPAYNFTTVSSHQNLTPAIYNQAVNAIKGVSGYGTYIDFIDNSTIAILDSKFMVYLFDVLASEANAIGGYT